MVYSKQYNKYILVYRDASGTVAQKYRVGVLNANGSMTWDTARTLFSEDSGDCKMWRGRGFDGTENFLWLANGGQNLLTLSAGWTADTTVLITGDATNNDSIVNSANVNLTVKGNADDFDTNTTITGGTGTDELLVTADAGTATLANVTNVEKVTIVDAVTAGTGVTVVPNLTTTKAQSIDAVSYTHLTLPTKRIV